MTENIPKRPVKVANCSGYHGDPAYEMYRQATLGDVDFITGDYLAEVNLANNAQAWRDGNHPGYENTAWEGLQQTIDIIAEKNIRVVINGGALDPKALAIKTQALVSEKGLDVRVAYLAGDDLFDKVGPNMPTNKENLRHLDSDNSRATPNELTYAFLNAEKGKPVPMVSAHAYLGARGIVDGLRRGADIIICGRVADASPVIAAAWFWHDWSETDYDQLAGSLIAGHLIECSAYVTGGNFSGFDEYSLESLIAPGFPIAEIASNGTCVITKHQNTQGFVNIDTVRCQFLYELQGSLYLNSDVSAHIADVAVEEIGKDRVQVSGIKGSPPPSTTKLAIFYEGGYESQILLNATGYATSKKWDLFEKQMRHFVPKEVLSQVETMEFQRVGVPALNPASQLESTTYLRVFSASRNKTALIKVAAALRDISLKHFSGYHGSMDFRTAQPIPFLAYYPAIVEQAEIDETINFVDSTESIRSYNTGHPSRYAEIGPREDYDPLEPLKTEGSSMQVRLGDVALGRSGDKGGNLNVGFFPKEPKYWPWLRSYMTKERMKQIMGHDYKDEFLIERVEFPRINAVHFVIYGILGRGVSSSSRLDGFGKGFADFARDRFVDIPTDC